MAGDSSMMMIVLLGGAGCCCLLSIGIPVLLYFVYQPFKDWVNKLFGNGGGGGTTGCVSDPNFAPVNFDPAKCPGHCLFVGGRLKKSVGGQWVDAGSWKECSAYAISPKAGQRVCPTQVNNKEVKFTVNAEGYCTAVDKSANIDDVYPSLLPKAAIAGKLYSKEQLERQEDGGGGEYRGQADPAKNIKYGIWAPRW